MPSRPEKILVAVHGIGEPVRCATVQAVAHQVYRHLGFPAALTLGALNAELVPIEGGPQPPGVYLVEAPPLQGLGFAEVYWADVPRGPAKDCYTLEEAKRWARVVVNRIRGLDRERPPRLHSDADYDQAAEVIGELIDGVRSVERLLFLARAANVLSFDLTEILVHFLGDVQVVAEFKTYRERILATFHAALARVHEQRPEAELYLVAHSEGSVVAFLAILQALRGGDLPALPDAAPPRPDWVRQLRGFMTIGSPLNKHLFLWPELVEGLSPPGEPAARIPWRNYHDTGDPVGFRLDDVRTWLDNTGWAPFFEFDKDKHDFGFTRYMFPGKAHTDYWQDEGVFGHFLHTVVKPAPAGADAPPRSYPPPGTKFFPWLISPVLPHLLAIGLLFLGVYLLYSAVVQFTMPESESLLSTASNVAALSLLLAGVTAAVRIPRVTKSWWWHAAGIGLFLLALWGAPLLLTDSARARLLNPLLSAAGWLGNLPEQNGVELLWAVGAAAAALVLLTALLVRQPRPEGGQRVGLLARIVRRVRSQWRQTVSLLALVLLALLLLHYGVTESAGFILATLVLIATVAVALIGWCRPDWGVRPVVGLGVAIVVGFMLIRVTSYRKFREDKSEVVAIVAPPPKADGAAKAGAYTAPATAPALTEITLKLSNLRLSKAPATPFSKFIKTDKTAKKEISEWEKRQGRVPTGPRPDPKPKPPDKMEPDEKPAAKEGVSDDAPKDNDPSPPLWPLFLAGPAFLYLWWVAVLTFDLAVAWQHYVRSCAAGERLRELDKDLTVACQAATGSPGPAPPAGAAPPVS